MYTDPKLQPAISTQLRKGSGGKVPKSQRRRDAKGGQRDDGPSCHLVSMRTAVNDARAPTEAEDASEDECCAEKSATIVAEGSQRAYQPGAARSRR